MPLVSLFRKCFLFKSFFLVLPFQFKLMINWKGFHQFFVLFICCLNHLKLKLILFGFPNWFTNLVYQIYTFILLKKIKWKKNGILVLIFGKLLIFSTSYEKFFCLLGESKSTIDINIRTSHK